MPKKLVLGNRRSSAGRFRDRSTIVVAWTVRVVSTLDCVGAASAWLPESPAAVSKLPTVIRRRAVRRPAGRVTSRKKSFAKCPLSEVDSVEILPWPGWMPQAKARCGIAQEQMPDASNDHHLRRAGPRERAVYIASIYVTFLGKGFGMLDSFLRELIWAAVQSLATSPRLFVYRYSVHPWWLVTCSIFMAYHSTH